MGKDKRKMFMTRFSHYLNPSSTYFLFGYMNIKYIYIYNVIDGFLMMYKMYIIKDNIN